MAAWPNDRLLAVLDIGKSNAKIVLLDPVGGAELASVRRPNRSLDGDPVRTLDIDGLREWTLDALAALPERSRIGAIVPVAHGAACVMLDRVGAPVIAPDYEDPALASNHDYDGLRDLFEQTCSPALPAGLNLARQIHYVQTRAPRLFARVAHILTYPQYWSFALCGVAATEITSLGCHTDLWLPGENRFSPLVAKAGWTALFPPIRPAADRLGPVAPAIRTRCGLPADCQVLCGIHDSNASFLRHRMHRPAAARFCVVSSGTWTVVLANGAGLDRLDPARDMLANVSAFGDVVGTARFMGGREYEAVAGRDAPPPTEAGLRRALDAGASVRPSFAAGGQFPDATGRLVAAGTLDPTARASLATLYVALLTHVALDLLGARSEIVIDGPLSQNPLYPGLLAALRPNAAVSLGDDVAGTVGGARCLLLGADAEPPRLRAAAPLPLARSPRFAQWVSSELGGFDSASCPPGSGE